LNRSVTCATVIVLGQLFSACGAGVPHRIADEQMAPEWGGQAYSDLLIIAAYNDRSYRVSAETQFAEELKQRGVTATPSYNSIPQLSSLESNSEIAEMLASTNHDGVLVVATLDEGYDYDYEDYLETRGMVYLLGGTPGAGTDMGSFISWAGSGQYSLYVGLWDAKSQQPVWQISTHSETSGSESEDTKALAEFVVNALREKGLLDAKQ